MRCIQMRAALCASNCLFVLSKKATTTLKNNELMRYTTQDYEIRHDLAHVSSFDQIQMKISAHGHSEIRTLHYIRYHSCTSKRRLPLWHVVH